MTAVRDAVPEDGAACAAIYRPYVTDTVITFEDEPPTAAERSVRLWSFMAANVIVGPPVRRAPLSAPAGPTSCGRHRRGHETHHGRAEQDRKQHDDDGHDEVCDDHHAD